MSSQEDREIIAKPQRNLPSCCHLSRSARAHLPGAKFQGQKEEDTRDFVLKRFTILYCNKMQTVLLLYRANNTEAATPQCQENKDSDEEDFIPGTSARKPVLKAQMHQPNPRQLNFRMLFNFPPRFAASLLIQIAFFAYSNNIFESHYALKKRHAHSLKSEHCIHYLFLLCSWLCKQLASDAKRWLYGQQSLCWSLQ